MPEDRVRNNSRGLASHKQCKAVDEQSLYIRGFHLAVLCNLAFAQPILDLLSRHPELFVIRRIEGLSVISLVMMLLAGPPLIVFLLELVLAKVFPRIRAWVGSVFMGLLGIPVFVMVFKRFSDLPDIVIIAAGVCAAVVFAGFYKRTASARTFVSVMGLVMVAVPLSFVLSPGVGKILWPDEVSELSLGSVDSRAPVVMVILDALPTSLLIEGNGHINSHRFPNLAELVSRSYWFRNATTVSEITETALPAILTGRFPEAGTLPRLTEYPQNLFTLFGGAYDLWAHELVTNLCPPELNLYRQGSSRGQRLWALIVDLKVVYLHLLLPEKMASELPAIDRNWIGFGAANDSESVHESAPTTAKGFFQVALNALHSDRRQSFEEIIAALTRSSSPKLFFFHVLLPHGPVEFVAPGYRYKSGMKGQRATWGSDKNHTDQVYQRYILQMEYVDHAIGELFDHLRELDLYDPSLIVVAADHGVSFRPNDTSRLLSDTNTADIVPVPLVIKAPHQERGQIVDTWVRSIDILPTMLDLLGTASPWPMDGISAFEEQRIVGGSLRVLTKERGVFTLDMSVLEDMREWAKQRDERFGTGSDPFDLYRIGPSPNLVGQKLTDLQHAEPAPAKIRLQRQREFDAFDPNGPTAPLALEGEAFFDRGGSISGELAIAINGMVCATTQGRESGSKSLAFSAMLPLRCLQPGRNEVEVFAIDENEGPPRLRLLGFDEPVERFQEASLLGADETHAWIIPAAAHGTGAGGAQWRTDLVLHNPNSEEATVTLALLSRETESPQPQGKKIKVAPSASTKLVDIVGSTLECPGQAGAILVGADLALLVTSRTYRQAGRGSCAQTVPAIPVEEATRGRAAVRLIHLTGSDRFRTNFGFVNLDSETVNLSIALVADNGKSVKTMAVDVAPFCTRQINKVIDESSFADRNLSAVVRSSSARASFMAYASVIDSGSDDAVFVRPAEAISDVVFIPTATHSSGAHGTWRTEVKVFNSAGRNASISLKLLEDEHTGKVESREFLVRSGCMASAGNVLEDVFNVNDTTAALRIDVLTGEVMVSSRTYLDLGEGSRGQLVPGMGSAESLLQGEEARLFGLGTSGGHATGFQTTFGLCSGSDRNIEVSVDLYAGDGTLFGRRVFDLPGHGSLHDSNIFAPDAADDLAGAFAVIRSETPGAHYFAFASVFDEHTGDALYIPAQRSP